VLYKFQGSGKTYKTSFIAAALSDYLQVDKLYLIGTSKSMWEEVYRYFSVAGNQAIDENYWYELGNKMDGFKPEIKS